MAAQPGAFAILIHQQRRRPGVGRQKPPAHQPEAERGKIGSDQLVGEPLRQPLHEMRLFASGHLDRVARFDREGPMRRDCVVEDRIDERRRAP